eukprot:COSAG04_NODE_21073_length_380_cov_1.185053_1_plen_44_part_10
MSMYCRWREAKPQRSQDGLLFVPLVVGFASVAEQRRRVAVARAI